MTSRMLLLLSLLAGALSTQTPAPQSSASGQSTQEKATLLHFCQQMEQATEHTLQSIRDRTDCWKRMQLQGMGDSTVDAGYRAAVADYDAAIKSDSVRAASDSVDQRLAAVQPAIQSRDLDGARRIVDGILAVQPDNQRALAFRDRLIALARARQVRTTLFAIAGGILLLALLMGVGARLLAARHQRQLAERHADASKRQAMLEIIDGVGRGKLYTIDRPVFRIGSAVSDRPEERNDLILSDADAFISRYHCTIVRKNDKYFLIDSSLNGTYLDEDLLDRGEHRPLEDGDEFSIAGMARVKFLVI